MATKDIPIIPALAGVLLLASLLYRFLLHPALLSPLSRVPSAHWTSSISSLWILRHRHAQTDTPAVHAAHLRLGPIVRLAPREISINSVDNGGIRSVYSAGFEKGDWYSNAFSNFGVQPMFAMHEHARHARRKRMVSHIYAKSVLGGSEAMAGVARIVGRERLRERIRADMHGDVDASVADGGEGEVVGGAVEFYTIFAAISMDLVAGYVFGLSNGSDLLRDREWSRKFLVDYKARQRYTFWPQECPMLLKAMGGLGLRWLLLPEWVIEANQNIESWIMSMCERAESTLRKTDTNKDSQSGTTTAVPEDFPTVYSQLRGTLLKEHGPAAYDKDSDKSTLTDDFRRDIASELLDHTLAGFDTSSITLVYLAWQLSRPHNKHWQAALRREILSLPSTLRADPKAVDALPILHAIIMETLRLHAAIPGQQPRQTPHDPSSPTILGGYEVPGGVRVQAQAWSLHREPGVFPDPEKFDPNRWIDASPEQTREMGRWFWAFSSGGRMCVGSNLAMLNMKATVSSIWEIFETDVMGDGSETEWTMRPNGGYIAEPLGDGKGGFCRLRVREVVAGT